MADAGAAGEALSVPVDQMVTTVYDLLRFQRNELGHPRETPPSITRADAFVNLQIFPRYYLIAEEVRKFLEAQAV